MRGEVGMGDEKDPDLCDVVRALVKNNQLLGEAGVAFPLVEVLKTHLQSPAVIEQACWALSKISVEGE